jgi:hypothetical protein
MIKKKKPLFIQRLVSFPTKSRTLETLWQRVEEQLELIPPDLCRTLVDSMPNRIRSH